MKPTALEMAFLMVDGPLTTKHVFTDPDLEMVYRGLMVLVEAIADLKAVILHDRGQDDGWSARE
jgi:hypothetical protein